MTISPESPQESSARPGLAVTSLTPGADSALTAALLIAMLVHDGANVAAMVPVETGIDEPCDAGSQGSLVRWAAGHMDDPRQVTPFALEAELPTLHAADADGTLLHAAAFERAHEELCDGRSAFVLCDAIGLCDAITPSLTTLDLIARWNLRVVISEPVSRWAIGHVRLLADLLEARDVPVAGLVLTQQIPSDDVDVALGGALRDTLAALLDRPVILLPRVLDVHDRSALVATARTAGLARLLPRAAPRADTQDET